MRAKAIVYPTRAGLSISTLLHIVQAITQTHTTHMHACAHIHIILYNAYCYGTHTRLNGQHLHAVFFYQNSKLYKCIIKTFTLFKTYFSFSID